MTINEKVKQHELSYHKVSHFVPRIPQLRSLEGWYSIPNLEKYSNLGVGKYYVPHYNPAPPIGSKIKLSCKWNDFLRAANSKHFQSCFRPGGLYGSQPILRFKYPAWCVIYLPDKAGNVLARAYAHLITGDNFDDTQTGRFVRYHEKHEAKLYKEQNRGYILVSPIYGQQLNHNMIAEALHDVCVLEATTDIYLER